MQITLPQRVFEIGKTKIRALVYPKTSNAQPLLEAGRSDDRRVQRRV